MDTSIFDNNRKFWQRIKPLFSNKQKGLKCDIILTKDGNIITNKHEIAEKLNCLFAQAVDNLEIDPFAPDQSGNDEIENILKRYESHPSVIIIKENVVIENEFSFRDISSLELEKNILNLDVTKASVSDDIPTKILVGTYDIVSNFISHIYNESKNNHIFPSSLKLADIIPTQKKGQTVSSYKITSHNF